MVHTSGSGRNFTEIIVYGAFFGVYSAAVTHVALFHRYEIVQGFKSLWKTIRRTKPAEGETSIERGEYMDVHNRLMAAYPEGNSNILLLK